MTVIDGRGGLLVHNPVLLDNLTPREIEVLVCIIGGMGNKQIAVFLGMSIQTVKTHIYRIFAALGVRDRTAAAVYAVTGCLPRNAYEPVLKPLQARRARHLADEASVK